MKNLAFALIAVSLPLQNGLYVCRQGNEDSICDQQVKTFVQDGELTALRVEYVGYCGSMGPYTYYCQNSECAGPGISFTIRDSRHYYWENTTYGFHCEFEKK